MKKSKIIYLKFDILKKIITSTHGETMIELVTSLALFAITMVTVATLFSASNRVFVKNFATEDRLSKQINNLANEVYDLNRKTPLTITFNSTGSGGIEPITKSDIKLLFAESEDSNSKSVLAKFGESID